MNFRNPPKVEEWTFSMYSDKDLNPGRNKGQHNKLLGESVERVVRELLGVSGASIGDIIKQSGFKLEDARLYEAKKTFLIEEHDELGGMSLSTFKPPALIRISALPSVGVLRVFKSKKSKEPEYRGAFKSKTELCKLLLTGDDAPAARVNMNRRRLDGLIPDGDRVIVIESKAHSDGKLSEADALTAIFYVLVIRELQHLYGVCLDVRTDRVSMYYYTPNGRCDPEEFAEIEKEHGVWIQATELSWLAEDSGRRTGRYLDSCTVEYSEGKYQYRLAYRSNEWPPFTIRLKSWKRVKPWWPVDEEEPDSQDVRALMVSQATLSEYVESEQEENEQEEAL